MGASAATILQLRHLLAERFSPATLAPEDVYTTGLPALDEVGLPRAALTEVVSPLTDGPGATLLLYGLLHAVRRESVILIDGADSFSPRGLPQQDLNRLLWVRCCTATESIKAADLAVRDGNVPLVLLLLTLNPASELRRIPATAWHRLQMLAEKSAVTLLIFTPQAQVGCASLRLSVSGAFPLEALQQCRRDLLPGLRLNLERRRRSSERNDDDVRRPACA